MNNLKRLIKEIIKESVSNYKEKKTLEPKHSRDDRILGKFFDHPDFNSKISVINGTHLPLDIEVEKMSNPETGKEFHLVKITTKIPEPMIQQLKRMMVGK